MEQRSFNPHTGSSSVHEQNKRSPIGIILILIAVGIYYFINHTSSKGDSLQTVDTLKALKSDAAMADGKPHYFDVNMVEVNQDGSPLSQKPGEIVDTTSSEYIVNKLSNKKHLSKAERKELLEAKGWIALEEQDKINMARVEALKNMNANFAKHCMSDWNGSCPGVVAYVKDRMNDPNSFEHVETGLYNSGVYTLVVMRYRGTNAFGATVTNYIKAKVNSNCQVVEVVEAE
ncbi:MAG: hypothetical protein P4L41_02920 [Flavipsychrobacter sp.]|nr:hypothetical protein [Flavipsychrobacter sp.]